MVALMVLLLLLLLPHVSGKTSVVNCNTGDPLLALRSYLQPGELVIGGITSHIFIATERGNFHEHPRQSVFDEPV